MKFVVDCMLGKLAKWLRILGFDTLYDHSAGDDRLLAEARREGRTLLSRDNALLARAARLRKLGVESDSWPEQVAQVLDAFGLWTETAPYTRCLDCKWIRISFSAPCPGRRRKFLSIIAYGRALAGLWRYQEAIEVYSKGINVHPEEAMLYRHRGHRYISIRDFEKAASDMANAAALNDKDFDIWYHLGLAHYLRGDFDKARAVYESCLKVAADDDSKIAVSNWLYAALRRLDRKEHAAKVLDGIGAEMKVEENTSYLNLLLFFKGLKTEDEVLTWAANSELDAATVGYSIGCWHLYSGQKEKARALFEKIVTGRYWPAFGFIDAEAELARME